MMMLASPVTSATLVTVTQPLLRPASSCGRRSFAHDKALRSSNVPACSTSTSTSIGIGGGGLRPLGAQAPSWHVPAAARRCPAWPSPSRQAHTAGTTHTYVVPGGSAQRAALALLLLQPLHLLLAQGLRQPVLSGSGQLTSRATGGQAGSGAAGGPGARCQVHQAGARGLALGCGAGAGALSVLVAQ